MPSNLTGSRCSGSRRSRRQECVALLVVAGMFPLRSRPEAVRSNAATMLVAGNGILLAALLIGTGLYGYAELRWSTPGGGDRPGRAVCARPFRSLAIVVTRRTERPRRIGRCSDRSRSRRWQKLQARPGPTCHDDRETAAMPVKIKLGLSVLVVLVGGDRGLLPAYARTRPHPVCRRLPRIFHDLCDVAVSGSQTRGIRRRCSPRWCRAIKPERSPSVMAGPGHPRLFSD